MSWKWPMVALLCLTATSLWAQSKLPRITFEEHSTEFADANRKYAEDGQYSDTLRDAHIIGGLAKILNDNPQIKLELGGHTAMNEDTTLALDRAITVMNALVAAGVDGSRLVTKSYGHRAPIISDEMILKLDSKVERDAANQRNRRVEIKAVGTVHQEHRQNVKKRKK